MQASPNLKLIKHTELPASISQRVFVSNQRLDIRYYTNFRMRTDRDLQYCLRGTQCDTLYYLFYVNFTLTCYSKQTTQHECNLNLLGRAAYRLSFEMSVPNHH